MGPLTEPASRLLAEVRACTICAERLPQAPRPVLQFHPDARILITGPAPGRKAHDSGVNFTDASGTRMREWMGVSSEVFYDPERVAILPMGFCYPGRGKSGDLAPRPECAPAWRGQLMELLGRVELTLVLGAHAQAYHMPWAKSSLTETVRSWRSSWPRVLLLPHPSPRNNGWLKKNPWFADEVLPALRQRVSEVLSR